MRGDRISGRSHCASAFFLRMPPPRIGVASTVRYLAGHLGGGSRANEWQRRLAEYYAVCTAQRPQSPAHEIAFSGNMAYHPNTAAAHFFAESVWPILREQRTGPRLEAGRQESARVETASRSSHPGDRRNGGCDTPNCGRQGSQWFRCSPAAERDSRSWKPGLQARRLSRPQSARRDWMRHLDEHLLIADNPSQFRQCSTVGAVRRWAWRLVWRRRSSAL